MALIREWEIEWMKKVIAYVSRKDTATIICVQCGKLKVFDVSRIADVYTPRRVNCPCGAVFEVLFEKRRHFRKGVRLSGTCRKTSSGNPQAISIRTLARTSIGFQIHCENLCELDEDQDIKTGDTLLVEFTLDNEPKTLIRGKVIVRNIAKSCIGAEFCSLDGHAQKQLGFYVMP
jgi:hypothetical protein